MNLPHQSCTSIVLINVSCYPSDLVIVLIVDCRLSWVGMMCGPGGNNWLTESKRRERERETYDFSNGDRAFNRAASYDELRGGRRRGEEEEEGEEEEGEEEEGEEEEEEEEEKEGEGQRDGGGQEQECYLDARL